MTVLEIQDLVVEVDGYPVVNGLNLTVEEGEQVGIVGDYRDALSLMDTLCGLTLPGSGEIWIYNLPPRQALQRGLIGYTHQPNAEDMSLSPVSLLVHPSAQPSNLNTSIYPLPHIEIFDKSTNKNYKFIDLKKRGELP